MKALTTILLTLLVLGGCASNNFKECISPPYENLGYVEVQHVLDKNKEILFDGLSGGCEKGNFVKLSNNEHYECKENISSQGSSQAVLLNKETRNVYNFKKDLEREYPRGCAYGSVMELCRNQVNKYSSKEIVLIEKGFEGPFTLENAIVRSSDFLLITSDKARNSIQREVNLTSSEQYFGGGTGSVWSCYYVDNNGKEFNFSDFK